MSADADLQALAGALSAPHGRDQVGTLLKEICRHGNRRLLGVGGIENTKKAPARASGQGLESAIAESAPKDEAICVAPLRIKPAVDVTASCACCMPESSAERSAVNLIATSSTMRRSLRKDNQAHSRMNPARYRSRDFCVKMSGSDLRAGGGL
jgi:hypothetical protein